MTPRLLEEVHIKKQFRTEVDKDLRGSLNVTRVGAPTAHERESVVTERSSTPEISGSGLSWFPGSVAGRRWRG